jgi:hypothetical protein
MCRRHNHLGDASLDSGNNVLRAGRIKITEVDELSFRIQMKLARATLWLSYQRRGRLR